MIDAEDVLDELKTAVWCQVVVNWWNDADSLYSKDLSHFAVTSPSGNTRVVYFNQTAPMDRRSDSENNLYKKMLFLDFDGDSRKLRRGEYDLLLTIDEMELIDKISKRKYSYYEKD